MIKTDHILFIASGAFQMSKPSDLIPELQGRLPIRVELEALTSGDFVRILTSWRALTTQYHALLNTEGVEVTLQKTAFSALLKWLSTSMKPLKTLARVAYTRCWSV